MKILIVLKKSRGGVGFANKRLSKALEKRGHTINIFSREEDLKSHSFIGSLFKMRKYLKNIEKEYDIIYTQDWSLALPLLFPWPIIKKKHFCNFCGNQVGPTKIFQNFVGAIIKKRLVVVGDSIQKRFPSSKLVYRGVNLKEFRPLKKKRNYIGWVNKETEEIDENFIKEVSKLAKLKYVVAKKIPLNKMNEFYNKCGIFISMPDSSAGFNNVWAESMAAGVPIVIGNDKGLGKYWPYERIRKNKDKISETLRIIRQGNKKNYRRWLIKNKISWKESAIKLEKIFKK